MFAANAFCKAFHSLNNSDRTSQYYYYLFRLFLLGMWSQLIYCRIEIDFDGLVYTEMLELVLPSKIYYSPSSELCHTCTCAQNSFPALCSIMKNPLP